jgi:hypothetical protein
MTLCFTNGRHQQTVALEACTQARNEGRDLAREGGDVIRAACKWSPELAAAKFGKKLNSNSLQWIHYKLIF